MCSNMLVVGGSWGHADTESPSVESVDMGTSVSGCIFLPSSFFLLLLFLLRGGQAENWAVLATIESNWSWHVSLCANVKRNILFTLVVWPRLIQMRLRNAHIPCSKPSFDQKWTEGEWEQTSEGQRWNGECGVFRRSFQLAGKPVSRTSFNEFFPASSRSLSRLQIYKKVRMSGNFCTEYVRFWCQNGIVISGWLFSGEANNDSKPNWESKLTFGLLGIRSHLDGIENFCLLWA